MFMKYQMLIQLGPEPNKTNISLLPKVHIPRTILKEALCISKFCINTLFQQPLFSYNIDSMSMLKWKYIQHKLWDFACSHVYKADDEGERERQRSMRGDEEGREVHKEHKESISQDSEPSGPVIIITTGGNTRVELKTLIFNISRGGNILPAVA